MVIIGSTMGGNHRQTCFCGRRYGMRNRFLLGAGVALAMALSWADAQAQLLVPPSGPGSWYFGGEVGWTNLESQRGRLTLNNGTGATTTLRERFNDGFNTGVRGGYEWGPWRFEE